MSSFDPFSDSPLDKPQDQPGQPVSDESSPQATVSFSASNTEAEGLHEFIDSKPDAVTETQIDDHAKQVESAGPNTSATFSFPTLTKTDLQDRMLEYFAHLLVSSKANTKPNSDVSLKKFDVAVLQAEIAYQVAGDDETYLYQVTVNESHKYNVFTATFSDSKLVQIEILGARMNSVNMNPSPFLGLYHSIMTHLGIGSVFMLHSRPVILATKHALPVTLAGETIEFTAIDGLEIRIVG